MKKNQVLIIGSSDDLNNTDAAEEIGIFVAQNDWILITGGRTGIMEAASRGAYNAGGIVVGILPGIDFEEANPFCSVVIPTGIGIARNMVNILSADIIVAIGGKYGTLNELTYASQLNKPLICCNFTGGYSSIYEDITNTGDSKSFIYTAGNVNDIKIQLKKFFK